MARHTPATRGSGMSPRPAHTGRRPASAVDVYDNGIGLRFRGHRGEHPSTSAAVGVRTSAAGPPRGAHLGWSRMLHVGQLVASGGVGHSHVQPRQRLVLGDVEPATNRSCCSPAADDVGRRGRPDDAAAVDELDGCSAVAVPTAAPALPVRVIRTGPALLERDQVVTTSGWRVWPGPAVGAAVGLVRPWG